MQRSESIVEEIVKEPVLSFRQYAKGKYLGKGGFARVHEFECLSSGAKYAGKIVPKSSLSKPRSREKLLSEISIHRGLKNQYIVNLSHSFEDDHNIYMLMELCPNKTLRELVKRRGQLTEIEAKCYMVQIVKALEFCHSKQIVHRDVKIGNLFLGEGMAVKLGDFGLAGRVIEGKLKKTVCGTPNYIAPEILEGTGYSYPVDIWSLGVVLYIMLVGVPPFESTNIKKTYDLIRMNAYSFPASVKVSDEAKSLITRILRSDPNKRPSLKQILQHDFFHTGTLPPLLLPDKTLHRPPSEEFVTQYLTEEIGKPTCETLPIEKSGTKPKNRNTATLRVWREQPPKLRVSQWTNYSKKYGMGYLLTNGIAGVCFNDNTKMVGGKKKAFYIDSESSVETFCEGQIPDDLSNKAGVFFKFVEQFNGADAREETPVFVKWWKKHKKCLVFRLTNNLVQVLFKNRSEILLSSDSKYLTYIDQDLKSVNIRLGASIENKSIRKRVECTKSVLQDFSHI